MLDLRSPTGGKLEDKTTGLNQREAKKWRREHSTKSRQRLAEAMGYINLKQFNAWAQTKYGPKWAYHLRVTTMELGAMLEAGLDGKLFTGIP